MVQMLVILPVLSQSFLSGLEDRVNRELGILAWSSAWPRSSSGNCRYSTRYTSTVQKPIVDQTKYLMKCPVVKNYKHNVPYHAQYTLSDSINCSSFGQSTIHVTARRQWIVSCDSTIYKEFGPPRWTEVTIMTNTQLRMFHISINNLHRISAHYMLRVET